ncbi:stomatin-like protein 3 [Scheffersomyces coipomensis]|uniref:stomatin-like protein 3 n=1 Tax=Scheffersomyces coipomensis TaxID=1788519 RepID=UPI00315CE38C
MSNASTHSFDPDTYKKSINAQPKPNEIIPMQLRNFAKTYETPQQGSYQKFLTSMGELFGSCGIFCFLCANPYKEVDQGEVGLIQSFGALSRTVEPGLSYVNTWSEKLTKVSIKINIREIPAQRCFTKDNVGVIITSVVYFNIIDPQKAIFAIDNIYTAIIERTQNTLRDVVGSRSLQDVVEKRDEIAESIEEIISKTAFDWGVHVESILIKDLTLPEKVQASLSMAAEAKRIGEGKIINAKAEVESAKLMRKAADILASKPAMQIRYLEALQNMAKSSGSRVIFMPSSQEVERMATSNVGLPSITGKERAQDLDEDDEWAAGAGIHQNSTGGGISDTRQITSTVALQEALRP